jgi:hypothetical protein
MITKDGVSFSSQNLQSRDILKYSNRVIGNSMMSLENIVMIAQDNQQIFVSNTNTWMCMFAQSKTKFGLI